MTKQEKLLLLQLILLDIRGNWAERQKIRIETALELIEQLKDVEKIEELKSTIKAYDYQDGRYFRDVYPYGYEGMGSLHGLSSTIGDKSNEFQWTAVQTLTYPEYRFEDWEDFEDR